jgi:hypothetical protein
MTRELRRSCIAATCAWVAWNAWRDRCRLTAQPDRLDTV